MKTIILTTDFSDSSKDAVRYGYAMARQTRANVVLCNAMIIPAEIQQPVLANWPEQEFDELIADSKSELDKLKTELEATVATAGFKPKLLCVSEAGSVVDVVKGLTTNPDNGLIVLGTHKGGFLSRFLTGNHADMLIDATIRPLMIVRPGIIFKPIKKIAFATEFNNPDTDLKTIYRLIELAKLWNAEILLTHVAGDRQNTASLGKKLADCLVDLSNKADYPHIYYRLISNNNIEEGLAWLCEHGQVDLLAMAHRSRNLFAEIFGSSHTKKMAGLSEVPLLVFPVINN
jgi:nucleotide-binding universal stress UspA family protein